MTSLLQKFSFGELYLPKRERYLKAWFKKRETIQKWYKVGMKSFILRRKFRHEWIQEATSHKDIGKIWKRLERRLKPPK